MEKSWSDQPDEVTRAEKLCGFYIEDHGAVEVRRVAPNGPYYLSGGNLFGSQTIKAKEADAIFKAIDLIYKKRKPGKPVTVPDGCELLDAPKKAVK